MFHDTQLSDNPAWLDNTLENIQLLNGRRIVCLHDLFPTVARRSGTIGSFKLVK